MMAILTLCFGKLVISFWLSVSRSESNTFKSSPLGWKMDAICDSLRSNW